MALPETSSPVLHSGCGSQGKRDGAAQAAGCGGSPLSRTNLQPAAAAKAPIHSVALTGSTTSNTKMTPRHPSAAP